ncbi:methyltransferase domain-containing protein [Desulfovibrio aerotolerans]|uniref:Methyltransferase domain-containing protein n=1 Tax=Solidesulfovibrio aerotolerans TaxID=295255 RepID=A0A7C9N3D6_9BACT|nr:methyltransferase domain-containing protein [Solidesulfovibrio aerotolerans]MYL84451.1 methyltransferase domain-containing protein [Solidesulfovibrio aerotolerans]
MTTADIRRRFDRAGGSYEAVAVVQDRVAEGLAGLCPQRLTGRVLEIGAGSGLLTRRLAPRLAAGGCYVALDLSPGMLAHAAMPQNVRRLAANGEVAPFAPATFDFLASASAMHWYADPAASLAANLRLLRPGAGFALAFYVAGTLGELEEASQATGFGSVYPMRPAAYYRELFASLPGIDWRMEETRHTVVHDSVRALLKSLKGAGVTHTAGRRVASPGRYRDFVRSYAARFGVGQGVAASYHVVTATGSRPTSPA